METDCQCEGVVLADIILVKYKVRKWKKSRLQWVDQQASGQSRCHLPRDTFPIYVMKFDTNRSLCLPLFPTQTAIQQHCSHHCRTQTTVSHPGGCGRAWDNQEGSATDAVLRHQSAHWDRLQKTCFSTVYRGPECYFWWRKKYQVQHLPDVKTLMQRVWRLCLQNCTLHRTNIM